MKTAVVIEDDDIVRGYFAAILERLGLKVLTADDGSTGIDVVKENPGVELIVLDLKMKKMGGKETYPYLKKISPQAKVIISSAYVGDEEAKELLEAGVDAILKKPFPMLSFKNTVIDLLQL